MRDISDCAHLLALYEFVDSEDRSEVLADLVRRVLISTLKKHRISEGELEDALSDELELRASDICHCELLSLARGLHTDAEENFFPDGMVSLILGSPDEDRASAECMIRAYDFCNSEVSKVVAIDRSELYSPEMSDEEWVDDLVGEIRMWRTKFHEQFMSDMRRGNLMLEVTDQYALKDRKERDWSTGYGK